MCEVWRKLLERTDREMQTSTKKAAVARFAETAMERCSCFEDRERQIVAGKRERV